MSNSPLPPSESVLSNSGQDIAKDLAAAIAARRLPPGTKLREEALARFYSVSRTKVRAALLMLSKDKLIEIVPDKGAFVAKPSATEAHEIFAVRRILEGALVRQFIDKASPTDYQRLRAHHIQEQEALNSDDPQARSRLLSDFHVLMAEIAGNKVMTDILKELVARSALIAMLYQSEREAACSSNEHGEFLNAAQKGETEQAVQLMLEHLDHVESALQFEYEQDAAKRDLVSALLA